MTPETESPPETPANTPAGEGLASPFCSLLPCPFCGGEAQLKRVGNDHTKKRAVHIGCSTFGCTIEMRVAAIRYGHDWCEDKAREKWNTRANDQMPALRPETIMTPETESPPESQAEAPTGEGLDITALLDRLPKTKDGHPIFLNDTVFSENHDRSFFGDHDQLEHTVIGISAGLTFDEYEGDVTVLAEDWEGGNLDCYRHRENVPKAI